jgi:hypothetical protein
MLRDKQTLDSFQIYYSNTQKDVLSIHFLKVGQFAYVYVCHCNNCLVTMVKFQLDMTL